MYLKMKDYFKTNKVTCLYDNNCKNKSNNCCRECSRNISRIVRDWFEPKDEIKDLSKRFEEHKPNIDSFKKERVEEYKSRQCKLPKED